MNAGHSAASPAPARATVTSRNVSSENDVDRRELQARRCGAVARHRRTAHASTTLKSTR